MQFVTIGKKENKPIIFLHGWGGGFSSFIYFAKLLSKKYYCIVCDCNDVLESDKVVSVVNFAEDLNNIINELNLSKVNLVGHSFGGRVIAKYASLFGKNIQKIVLVDAAGLPARRSLCYYINVIKYKLAKKLVKCKLASPNILQKFGSADYKKLKPEQKQSFINIVSEDLTNCYKQINCPTLLFWGEKDKETPMFMAKKLKKLINDCGLVRVLNGGHFSYLDAPNLFIKSLENFFN